MGEGALLVVSETRRGWGGQGPREVPATLEQLGEVAFRNASSGSRETLEAEALSEAEGWPAERRGGGGGLPRARTALGRGVASRRRASSDGRTQV